MPDVVGAGEIAVHAIERGRLRRPNMRTHILDLIPGERPGTAVALTAASSVVTRLVADTEAARCSSRSSIHLTGRPQTWAATLINTT